MATRAWARFNALGHVSAHLGPGHSCAQVEPQRELPESVIRLISDFNSRAKYLLLRRYEVGTHSDLSLHITFILYLPTILFEFGFQKDPAVSEIGDLF